MPRVAVRVRTEAVFGGSDLISSVVSNGWSTALNSAQEHHAVSRSEREVRVQRGSSGLRGLAVGPDYEELAGSDARSRRKLPLGQVRCVIAQIKAAQINGGALGVVQFDPRFVLAKVVGDAGNVVRLDFVDPKFRERIKR